MDIGAVESFLTTLHNKAVMFEEQSAGGSKNHTGFFEGST